MYGLFICTYDYYEWKDLVCVSESVEKLLGEVEEDTPYTLTNNKHKEFSEKEQRHYYICEVEFL